MKISIGAIAVLVVGYIFVAPYLTVYQMKVAAEKHDGESLSEYVDFPSLRQNLKDQMNTMLGKEMAKEVADDNPFAALGAAFGGMMVEKMVDAYITPSSITALMKGEKLDTKKTGNGSKELQTKPKPFGDVSMSYESFSKFSITMRDGESNDEAKFILRRRGIGWKLTEILLPI